MTESGTTRRRIYLDFDGVVNALGPDQLPGAWDRYQVRKVPATNVFGFPTRFPTRCAPGVLDAIRRWHHAGVDIVWASTWRVDTASISATWDLPRLPFLEWKDHPAFDESKGAAVAEHFENDPAGVCVWIDDDLGAGPDSTGAVAWAGAHQVHTLTPMPALGLTQAHVDRIDRWLDADQSLTSTPTETKETTR